MTSLAAALRERGIAEVELAPLEDPEPLARRVPRRGLAASSSTEKTGNWRIATEGMDFDDLLGDAARRSCATPPSARPRRPGSTSRSTTASMPAPGPTMRRSTGRAGSPRKAPSPSCARWPSRKARRARCGSASPARTAGRSPPSSGWSRMAKRRSTSSLMPRMRKALSPGTMLGMAMFRRALDEDRVRAIDYGTGDDAYKRDWMAERRPLWRLAGLQPAHPARPGRRGAGACARRSLSARGRSR